MVFFAVFGYDTLTTAAEEARDPQRDLPRAVLLSLAVSLTLYIAMSLVLTGIVRYDTLDNAAPVATAFVARPALGRASSSRSRRSPGISSVMLAFLARLRAHLVRDEPRRPAAGLVRRAASAFRHALSADADRRRALTRSSPASYPIEEVAELVNIGTLSAFVVICLAVIVLRRTRPDAGADSHAFRAVHAAGRNRLFAVAVVATARRRLGALRGVAGPGAHCLFFIWAAA